MYTSPHGKIAQNTQGPIAIGRQARRQGNRIYESTVWYTVSGRSAGAWSCRAYNMARHEAGQIDGVITMEDALGAELLGMV